MTLALKYAFFAALATMVNIGTQYVSLFCYNKKFSLYLAMGFGTLTGLIVKYVLDKKHIFYYEVRTFREDISKFIFYSLMGVFTTLIFWGSELIFNACFKGQMAKYIGAIIGLTIGYITKYRLDKKFVFNNNHHWY
jgi:putative flippase GtrA